MKRTSDKNNYCVYVHINKTNGKMYIGQTYNLHERWRGEGKNYFNSIKFFNAIKKYGWNNFIHEVIKSNLYKEEADELEKELIETFDTIKTGYNIKSGGARGVLSSESLKKMGEGVHKAFTEHPEIKEKIGKAHLGMVHTEEAKRKMMLGHSNTIVIEIYNEIGSIRYWAKRIGVTHQPLLWQKKRYGFEAMVQYIKDRLPVAV